MGRTDRKTTIHGQSSQDVLRATKKSCEKAKNKRTGASRMEDTIVRASSLPMTRSNSANSQTSSANTNTEHEESETTSDELLELNVSAEDKIILGGTTPRKKDFIKDSSIKGIKSRVGWTPKRVDDRSSTYNRHGKRFKEYTLRHEHITKSDMDLMGSLNRNTFLYDINEDDLAQLRAITLKNLNNLERIYRKIRRGTQYSHFHSVHRNIQRNFRI
jgi:hypothetical protein